MTRRSPNVLAFTYAQQLIHVGTDPGRVRPWAVYVIDDVPKEGSDLVLVFAKGYADEFECHDLD